VSPPSRKAAARTDSNDAELQYYLALAHWQKHHWKQTDSLLRLVLRLEPRFAEAYLALYYLPFARRPSLFREEERGVVPESWRPALEEAHRFYQRAFRTDPLVIFHSPDPDFPLPTGPFIAAGYDHSCAITVAGPTLCWGLNEYGQVGDGTTANQASPATVAGGHTFAAITAGLRHTCALDTNGAAWCWGDNTYGELGDGSHTLSDTPVAVAGGLQFAYLKAGELSTCGVTSTGIAYCWGDNEYGQLGDGTATTSSVPVKVAFQP